MNLFVERHLDEIRDELERSKNDLEIPIEDIESATDNFADENIIQQNSSGTLYRGQLLKSEKMIDILVRDFKRTRITELIMLCFLKHENISSILYCKNNDTLSDILFIHKIEANGSLAEHLLLSTGLTWTQRLSICIGVGRALEYIHNSDFVEAGYYVIHGNIKSSKILLDESWQPKLQGFESAMLAERNTLLFTNEYEGTLQYKDPAYEETGALTAKSDVFSFGVVLFEVLFGRKASSTPNDQQEEDNWNFAEFARSHWKNKTLDDVIDPDMRKNMDSNSIEIFSNVAYACLTEQREERPNMDQVVRELEESFRLQKYHEHSMVTETSSSHLQEFDRFKIPLEEIEMATDHFADGNLLRGGGFGTVYKGTLLTFGKPIDIVARRLHYDYGQGDLEFWKEITMLSDLKHENLVSFVGYCDEKGEKIIINKYEARGSLDKYLNSSSLTWTQRLEICAGIARALNYIHYHDRHKYSVIHRNIKSSKILLDENWQPKLSGFELAMSNTSERRHRLLLAETVGTLGYVDPTYEKTGFVNHKSDVFSFGVVLFEVLCGRKAFIPNPQEQQASSQDETFFKHWMLWANQRMSPFQKKNQRMLWANQKTRHLRLK